MISVTFSVPYVIGKARPRVLKSGRTYTPAKTVNAERGIADAYTTACMEKYGRLMTAPPHVPVTMTIETVRPLPKSRPKSVESEPDTYKPDADNIFKLAGDALNEIAYADDAQVTKGCVEKLPRKRDAQEVMTITVSWDEEKSNGSY